MSGQIWIYAAALSGLRQALVLFEVLRLVEDLLVNFIPIYRWVAMFRQYQDQAHLQFSFDVITLAPVGVLHLVIDHNLHSLGKGNQLVLWILKVIFDRQ